MKICELCGSEYEKGLRKYCSSRCYHRAKEGKAGKPKHCAECGAVFMPANGNEQYCSEKCKAAATRRSRANYFNKTYTPKTHECPICGGLVEGHKVYCSQQCKEKAKWKREIENKYGSWENYESFLKEKRQAKIKEMHERKQKEKEERRITGTCVVCGNEFTTFNPAQKTCSKKCSKRLQYTHKEKRIPKEQIVDKDITLEALYRRDSGVCYLCGGMCDWGDKQGNIVGDTYPTIDHMIPVSRGAFIPGEC